MERDEEQPYARLRQRARDARFMPDICARCRRAFITIRRGRCRVRHRYGECCHCMQMEQPALIVA